MNPSDDVNEVEHVAHLIANLASDDPPTREQSREELVRIGGPDVTRALVAELVDPRHQVRWEAAKALASIADPVAAAALMHALDDDHEDVRWVAAEGLTALGNVGLLTVLSGLTKRAHSIEFCRSAHHVLHDLKKKEDTEVITPVLDALTSAEPEVTAPPAAYRALSLLKQGTV